MEKSSGDELKKNLSELKEEEKEEDNVIEGIFGVILVMVEGFLFFILFDKVWPSYESKNDKQRKMRKKSSVASSSSSGFGDYSSNDCSSSSDSGGDCGGGGD